MTTLTAPSPVTYVREFHETYGAPIRDTPTANPPEVALRIDLIAEEVQEWYVANYQDHDQVERADALADIVYVAYGAALCHGIDLDTTDALPGALWGLLDAYADATARKDLPRIRGTLAGIVRACYSHANRKGIPLDAVLAEVHRSNMSKLDLDGTVLRRPDGKVLKGPNYSPPSIAPILAAYGSDQ